MLFYMEPTYIYFYGFVAENLMTRPGEIGAGIFSSNLIIKIGKSV